MRADAPPYSVRPCIHVSASGKVTSPPAAVIGSIRLRTLISQFHSATRRRCQSQGRCGEHLPAKLSFGDPRKILNSTDCVAAGETLTARFPLGQTVCSLRDSRPDGGVVTQRFAKPCTPVRFRLGPPHPIRSGAIAIAALAQVVEHIIRNDGVRGSSPLSGTISCSAIGTPKKGRISDRPAMVRMASMRRLRRG